MGRVTSRYRVLRLDDGVGAHRPDSLAAEEPLEIRVGGRPLTVTMRTPGDDFDLARGFLVSEGVVTSAEDVTSIRYCAGATVGGANTYNVVDVILDDAVPAPDASLERNFYTTSSCGVCGKASLDAVRTVSRWSVDADPVRLSATTISTLPDTLRAAQRVFDRTGGLHAAGLFDADGTLSCVREDVGRHNAVDKVIGEQVLAGHVPLADHVLQVSGRLSFEIVQKAAVAGIPIVSAVSAPSSLAVEAGERFGMTLVGFVRDERLNVYTHPERLIASSIS